MENARDSARDSLRASLPTDLRAPAGSSSSPRLDRMERTLPQARALVIGGSVGGLFATHLLRQAGWHVRVFERAAGDLGDRGTGIGTREELFAVMRRIGLAADGSLGIDVDGRIGLDRSGAVIHELPVRAVTSAWSRVWRPLRQALPDACYTGRTALARIEAGVDGVTALFDDGARAEADLLVGADGLHSTVRAQFLPELAPRYAGYVDKQRSDVTVR